MISIPTIAIDLKANSRCTLYGMLSNDSYLDLVKKDTSFIHDFSYMLGFYFNYLEKESVRINLRNEENITNCKEVYNRKMCPLRGPNYRTPDMIHYRVSRKTLDLSLNQSSLSYEHS